MKKIIFILLVMLTTILVGCDTKKKIEGETIEVKHSKGTVYVSTNIKKAAVFDYGVLDIIDNLEIDVEVATPTSNIPNYLNHFQDSFDIGSIKEANLEKVYEFNPDVIFISSRLEASYDDLNEIAPTIYIEIDSTKYLEDLKNNVLLVSKLFHVEEKADALISSIENDILEVKEITKDFNKKALIVLVNGNSMSAYGSGSRFGLIHDVLGIKEVDPNINISTHGQQITYEYLSSKNPDIIFAIDRASVVEGTPSSNIFDNVMMENVTAYNNNDIHYLNATAWYIVSGGITSTKEMILNIKNAIE